MSLPTLVHLSYSPWSLPVRWALAHHEVPYRGVAYQPTLSEPWLRFKLRRPWGKVTVPVWFDGDRVLGDSFEIAQEADRRGAGPSLFPAGRESEIRAWNDRGQAMLNVARARFAMAALDDPQQVLALLPPALGRLGGVGRFIAHQAAKSFVRKYDLDAPGATDGAIVDEGFARLAEAVGEGDYIFDDFSYADIVMAMAVGILAPPKPPLFGRASASLPPMPDAGLQQRYAGLIEWRDGLLRRHHPSAEG